MKKLDLQAETNLLLARQIIKRNNCSSDIIDWALLLMENGYDSENLYILAGLEAKDVWTIDNYFKKTIEDLNIESNIKKQTLLYFYLIYCIKAAIENPNILDETVFSLSGVIYDTSYSRNEHLNFFFLYDDLEELTGISREELLNIKSGNMDYNDLLVMADKLMENIELYCLTSTLPDAPDKQVAEKVLVEMREELYK